MKNNYLGTLYRTAAVLMLIMGLSMMSSQKVTAASPNSNTTQRAYASVLFSRSELSAADSICQADDTNIARLDTVVAPYLKHLNLKATGTVETGRMLQADHWCTHGIKNRETYVTSWNDLKKLATDDGWTFVSHSSTYPVPQTWSRMTQAELVAQTCGSAQAINSQGLPGANGMFAWPNNYVYQPALSLVEKCFDVSRQYGTGISSQSIIISPPYFASAQGLSGGRCNDTNAACSTLHTVENYRLPSLMINKIKNLKPGQWINIQAYLLVTEKNPAYISNASRWDCTSPNSADHWSNDVERYCYSDFQEIMSVMQQQVHNGLLIVTDPATVAHAFGRVSP